MTLIPSPVSIASHFRYHRSGTPTTAPHTGAPGHLTSGSRPSNPFASRCTVMIRLPSDFKEFLRLLSSTGVEYLLVGGYAVGYHGYPRTTGDLDLWIATDKTNAQRITQALNAYGFDDPSVEPKLFQTPEKIIRMGVPPMRIELLTTISGVDFRDCYARRIVAEIDGVQVSIIHPNDLRANKRAAGRTKDQDDLEHLP
ncbi:MAG: hypothetical protein GC162_02125 [Planctomycetes bacterium]|nr:hypothetical protein [Planctomycetota bacterium]